MNRDPERPVILPVFTPDRAASINRVYEKALAAIGGDTAHGDRRAALARHIMDLAREGELDEDRLRLRALNSLMNGAVDRQAV